jgi:hypothetical protein
MQMPGLAPGIFVFAESGCPDFFRHARPCAGHPGLLQPRSEERRDPFVPAKAGTQRRLSIEILRAGFPLSRE